METHVAPSMLFSCCITASEDVTRDPVEGVAGISTSTMEMPATPSMLFSCCITANGDVTVANITVIYNSVDPASTRTRVRFELLQISKCAHRFSNCATAAGVIMVPICRTN